MLCVCIEVVYVSNFMCMYSALRLNFVLGEVRFRKLSIIIIIIILYSGDVVA